MNFLNTNSTNVNSLNAFSKERESSLSNSINKNQAQINAN
jgi:hypothetical protein